MNEPHTDTVPPSSKELAAKPEKEKETSTKPDNELEDSFLGVDDFEGPEPDLDPFEDVHDPFVDEKEEESGVGVLHKPKCTGDKRNLQRQKRYMTVGDN